MQTVDEDRDDLFGLVMDFPKSFGRGGADAEIRIRQALFECGHERF